MALLEELIPVIIVVFAVSSALVFGPCLFVAAMTLAMAMVLLYLAIIVPPALILVLILVLVALSAIKCCFSEN